MRTSWWLHGWFGASRRLIGVAVRASRLRRRVGIAATLAAVAVASAVPAPVALAASAGPATLAAAPAPAKPAPPAPAGPQLELQSPSAVLMDASSGEIIFAKNPHERRHPASVTKVMTLLLAVEAIEQGRLRWDEPVTASRAAKELGGTTIFLQEGEQLSAREMLVGIAVASANDGALAIAEHLGGSESAFVAQMNARARELGMTNTHFMNPHGFDHPEHYTTAHDLALLSRAAAAKPALLELTSTFTDKILHQDGRRNPVSELANRNRLVRFYTGADGLKTGWTRDAGYTLAATARRGGVRMIATVMGAPNPDVRMADGRKLLDFGFSRFVGVRVAPVGQRFGQPVRVLRGRSATVDAVLAQDFFVSVPRGAEKEVGVTFELAPQQSSPIQPGQRLGWLIALRAGREVGRAPLVAKVAVPRAGFLHLWWQIFAGATSR